LDDEIVPAGWRVEEAESSLGVGLGDLRTESDKAVGNGRTAGIANDAFDGGGRGGERAKK
jgi:hypothetical protein